MSISLKTRPRLDSRMIRIFTLEGKYDCDISRFDSSIGTAKPRNNSINRVQSYRR